MTGVRIAAKSMTIGSSPLRSDDAPQSSIPFGPILAGTTWASIRGVKSNAEGSESRSNSNVNVHTSDKGEKSTTSMIQENPNSPITTLTAPVEMPPNQRSGDPQRDLQSDGATSVVAEPIDAGATAGRPATDLKVGDSRQRRPPTSNQTETTESQLSETEPIENWRAGAEQIDLSSPSPTAEIALAAGTAFGPAMLPTVEAITQLGSSASNGSTANSSTIAGNGIASHQAIKSTQSKNSEMVPSADSEPTTPAGPAKGNLAPSGEASSNGGQAGGQGSQHAEAGSTATLATSTAASSSTASTTSTMAPHATSHQTSLPDSVRNDNGGASLPAGPSGTLSSDQLNSGATTVPSGINTARLIQSMSESEMCVGMHSVEFGEISVRASVSQQQMLAQISTEHVGLSAAISAHIPSIQEKFGNDYGLHASIQVNHGGASFSDERGKSSQREQRASVLTPDSVNSVALAEIERLAARVTPTTGDGYRLDIRA